MGRKCSVENCRSDSSMPEHSGVTYHKVPRHPDVRPKWLSLCRIPEDKNSGKLFFVCSRHFLRADFCNFKGKKYMLRQGVLPSVFPWDKSKLEAIKAVVTGKKDPNSVKKVAKEKSVKKTEGKSPEVVENVTSETPAHTTKEEPSQENVISLQEEIKVEPTEIKKEEESEASVQETNKSENVKPESVALAEPDIKTEIKEECVAEPERSEEVGQIQESLDPFDQHQMSQNASPACTPITFAINSCIEVLDNNNVWYPATITEVDYEESEILIHFEKSANKSDEWISMSSPRLRSLQLPIPHTDTVNSTASVDPLAVINPIDVVNSTAPIISTATVNSTDIVNSTDTVSSTATVNATVSTEGFEVGERCMAMWCNSRKFPATITKKLKNDSFEVLFDDGFVKVVKAQKISKMDITKPAQSSPLFEPVKGTKEERREKKRKLNVAELFSKRPRLVSAEDKRRKSSPLPTAISAPVQPVEPPVEETCPSPAPQISHEEPGEVLPPSLPEPAPVAPVVAPVTRWHPSWENGKPVGVESTIEAADGLRKSFIVPDPRLPTGWTKHLTQRIHGNSIGKWDTVILAPDGKKFRSRQEVKNYLELHPGVEATLEMFDFSLYRGPRKKARKPREKVPAPPAQIQAEIPAPPVESLPVVETPVVEHPPADEKPPKEEQVEEAPPPEEPPVSLKIIFENDSYKCPIDGCGKNFRRENLALMHVKHYHSEYTKYLESMPNVADLAYARTVGESLDRSPGSSKSSFSKSERATASKGSKVPVNIESPAELPLPALETKARDSEIIKLLSQKPPELQNDIQPLPSGLPSNMYPDIKLKDLLGKNDDIAMRDDINIKNLCSSRPSQGIKTILPVRHAVDKSSDTVDEKPSMKRKRTVSDAIDPKGKTTNHSASSSSTLDHPITTTITHQPPPSVQHLQSSAPSTTDSSETSDVPTIPSAFDLAPPPAGLETTQAPPKVTQFDGVIIEGGKIIKLERMKQEEIINCTCGFVEEDGLMIQCELCLCWQHAYCNNIQKESEVPEKYVCYICLNPLRERLSAKYLHDQEWLKQGTLPVGSYHSKDKLELDKRFEKLKRCHDLSGGLLELRDYMHTLALKLKIAEEKNHPKLYLWSKPWDKPKLPEKSEIKDENDIKPKLESDDHPYIKNSMDIDKQQSQNPDSMLMMILKSSKEEIPMLDMNQPIIPRPEAAIDSDDCRLNLLDHISHGESLVEDRLDDFEKKLDALEEGINMEEDEDYPKTRQTLQLLMRDLDKLKTFSELPMI